MGRWNGWKTSACIGRRPSQASLVGGEASVALAPLPHIKLCVSCVLNTEQNRVCMSVLVSRRWNCIDFQSSELGLLSILTNQCLEGRAARFPVQNTGRHKEIQSIVPSSDLHFKYLPMLHVILALRSSCAQLVGKKVCSWTWMMMYSSLTAWAKRL